MSEIDKERLEQYFKGMFDDKDYLQKLFCDKGKEDELEHLLRKQWYELLSMKELPDKKLDHILHKINYDINVGAGRSEDVKRKIVKWFTRIAAVLIIPVIIYSVIRLHRYSEILPSRVEIVAPAWSRVQFSLPDGTQGWLNSQSSLNYNSGFNAHREVVLHGEAFFDVVENPAKPFRVKTHDVIVTVLGTKFNVEAYDNENSVGVVLEEGKLRYYNKDINKTFSIEPNEYIIYDKSARRCRTEVVQAEKYIGWKEGKLIFRNDPLDVVAKRLERWYNIEVQVVGSITNQPILRATFVDEDLEEVLNLLKLSLPIDYVIQYPEKLTGDIYAKRKVTITSKIK